MILVVFEYRQVVNDERRDLYNEYVNTIGNKTQTKF